ncbi:MAG: hypothetical protein KBS41_01200 [Oscillospiraceae bacterium]|nr:hypothetical protein [Candidatus Equicaccousia limihippi]
MRELTYNVSLDGISPCTVQPAGVQGDDAATKVKFVLANDIDIQDSTFILNVTDGSGVFFATDFLTVTDRTVSYTLPVSVTAAGGVATLVLVVNGENSATLSYPAKLRFEPTGESSSAVINYTCEITDALKACNDKAGEIQEYVQSAADFAEQANNAMETVQSISESIDYIYEEVDSCMYYAEDFADRSETAYRNTTTYKNTTKTYRDQAKDYRDESEDFCSNAESYTDVCADHAQQCSGYAAQARENAELCEEYAENIPQTVTATLDTEIWENQPLYISGDMSHFSTGTVYYVHIVNRYNHTFTLSAVEGDNGVNAYNTVFELPNFDTGNYTSINENSAVCFESLSPSVVFKSAGEYSFEIEVPTAKAYEISIDGKKRGADEYYVQILGNSDFNYYTDDTFSIRGFKVGGGTIDEGTVYQNILMRLSVGSKLLQASHQYIAVGENVQTPSYITDSVTGYAPPTEIPDDGISVNRISINADNIFLNGLCITVKPIF